MMKTLTASLGAMALLLALMASTAALAVSDEIQVYTDDINAPGERGLELHVNTTPRGRRDAAYEGELPPHHGMRITPEFSWGLTRTVDIGLYVPMATSAEGNAYLGGAKGRLKWLPVQGGGWYFGMNAELANQTRKFSESHIATELRVMLGYRAEDWLIGMNPILAWNLSPGYRGSPELEFAYKAMHKVAPGISLGGEYYHGTGTLRQRLPRDEQERSFYLVMDYEHDPWAFNVGIGHGRTPASDDWTVKAIFEMPFN